jgi:putative transposase
MVGESAPPRWLSFDYLLAQFSVQRKAAIRKYRLFVQESLKHGPIWTRLNNQIYLGGKEFIDKEQRHVQIQRDDLQIPKVQRRSIAKSWSEHERIYKLEMKLLLMPMPVAHTRIRRLVIISVCILRELGE